MTNKLETKNTIFTYEENPTCSTLWAFYKSDAFINAVNFNSRQTANERTLELIMIFTKNNGKIDSSVVFQKVQNYCQIFGAKKIAAVTTESGHFTINICIHMIFPTSNDSVNITKQESTKILKFIQNISSFENKKVDAIPTDDRSKILEWFNRCFPNKKDITGICNVCGCTWNNACYDSVQGPCWWHNKEQTLCSHCALDLI